MNVSDIGGWVGAALLLVANFLVRQEIWSSLDVSFIAVNVVGALLLGYHCWQRTAWQPLVIFATSAIIMIVSLFRF